VVFPLKVTLLETNSSLTREDREEYHQIRTDVLLHVSNLYFNISFLQTERIYFQVLLPKGSKEKSKPMFFCHRWSIGKVIDVAASLASLKNDNNKLMAKVTSNCMFFLKF
jgi:hypothetical protein